MDHTDMQDTVYIKANKPKSVFDTLRAINVNEHTEKLKQGNAQLTYLSWAWAIDEVMKKYPNTEYEIVKIDEKPYLYDEDLGYMVFTKVTIDGQTKEMWLPVMDGANKAMKNHSYTYQVKEYKNYKWTGNYVEKTCEAATMFDINKTIMRCLVKNLAMFGLGLYIYAGEDLPMLSEEDKAALEMEKLIPIVAELQTEMNRLVIDWRGEVDPKTKDWILKKTGVKTQDIGELKNPDDCMKLIAAYNTLIQGKKEKENVQKQKSKGNGHPEESQG